MTRSYKILVLGRDEDYPLWIEQGFRKLGHETKLVKLAQSYRATREILKAEKPDFVVTRNMYLSSYFEASLEDYQTFFTENEIPFFIWYQDNPSGLGGLPLQMAWEECGAPKKTLFATVDSSQLEFFEKRKAPAFYLPIAAPDFLLQSFPAEMPPADSRSLGFTFSGSLAIYPRGVCLSSSREECSLAYFRIAEEIFHKRFEMGADLAAKEAIASIIREYFLSWADNEADAVRLKARFVQSITDLFEPPDRPTASMILEEILLYHDFYQTFVTVSHLARTRNLKIFGNPLWKAALPDYPDGTPKLSLNELFSLYHQSSLSLSYTKWQFRRAIHERPFLVLACAGLPLVDYRADLSTCFDLESLPIYKNLQEAESWVDRITADPRLRSDLIQKSRPRVLSEHLYSHRAQTIVQKMQEHFGLK